MAMKVLHINTDDLGGGAAIAAFRLHTAMNNAGIESSMLVLNKRSKDIGIHEIYKNHSFLKSFVIEIRNWIMEKVFRNFFKPYAFFSFPFFGFNISRYDVVQKADIIYLHWINNSMLNIRGIKQILKLNKPVVWFMHDMFPLTGGCHYSFDCLGYTKDCKQCPLIFKHKGFNISKIILGRKIKKLSKYSNLHISAPSNWLAKCAEQSTLFKKNNISVCHNVIDTSLYKPYEKALAKKILGLDNNKKTILFCAVNISDPYKGVNYLIEALKQLNSDEFQGLLMGNHSQNIETQIQLHYVGYLTDDYSKILAYNAADVFITSSVAENFPNVVVEAMACGVPCVGFDVGGIPDLIQHNKTGYLAKLKSSEDLANGIKYITSTSQYGIISQNCRNFVIEKCSFNNVLKIHEKIMTNVRAQN